MLDPQNFADIQQALVIVFTPFIHWGLAFLAAGGILIAIGWCWLGLLRWLSRGGE